MNFHSSGSHIYRFYREYNGIVFVFVLWWMLFARGISTPLFSLFSVGFNNNIIYSQWIRENYRNGNGFSFSFALKNSVYYSISENCKVFRKQKNKQKINGKNSWSCDWILVSLPSCCLRRNPIRKMKMCLRWLNFIYIQIGQTIFFFIRSFCFFKLDQGK